MQQFENNKFSGLEKDDFIKINSEISFEEDNFIKARLKGARSWILKHVFYKSNKILLFLYIVLSILAGYIGSLGIVIIGYAIADFINPSVAGNNIGYFTLRYDQLFYLY